MAWVVVIVAATPSRWVRLTCSGPVERAGASSTRLNPSTSLRAPKSVTLVPSQTELCTALGSAVARSSSRVTLSPPSLAQTAASEAPGAWAATGQPHNPHNNPHNSNPAPKLEKRTKTPTTSFFWMAIMAFLLNASAGSQTVPGFPPLYYSTK